MLLSRELVVNAEVALQLLQTRGVLHRLLWIEDEHWLLWIEDEHWLLWIEDVKLLLTMTTELIGGDTHQALFCPPGQSFLCPPGSHSFALLGRVAVSSDEPVSGD